MHMQRPAYFWGAAYAAPALYMQRPAKFYKNTNSFFLNWNNGVKIPQKHSFFRYEKIQLLIKLLFS